MSDDRAEILREAETSRLTILENTWVKALRALNGEQEPTRLKQLVQAEADARAALAEARGPRIPGAPSARQVSRRGTKQVFKNRSEAFRLFVEHRRLGVSRATFYSDAERFTEPDKTVLLAELCDYEDDRRDHLAQASNADDLERKRKLSDFDLRRAELDVQARERAARKDDDAWMESSQHITQMAAFSGLIAESLEQEADLQLEHLEYAYQQGGKAGLRSALEELHASAMTNAVSLVHVTVTFEDAQEEPAQ